MSNVAYTSHVEELGGSSSGSFQLTDGGVLEGISRVQQEKKGHPNKARLSVTSSPEQPPAATKRKRSLAGTPDPDAEVIALSPRTLLATNRFVCEICNKGFQRDQNLQLHRRGHNLPWKLKQTRITGGPKEGQQNSGKKRVYVCPEENCVHHHPSRALGDLTGIKKHFCRKHGEKKWKCDKCSKRYAVQSDWKAHLKTCGTREYRCDCGTLFSRRDSFITHRAFCDALAEENTRAAPHTQGDQSGDDANQCPSEEPSIGAPHISHSQVNRGPSDLVPSFSETAMPSMPTKNCENPMNVGGIASLTSKWLQGAASPVLRKGSGLPSWLDSGPLPGLPGPMKGFLGIPSSLAMNEVGSSSPSEASNDAMHRGSLSNNCSAGGLLATLFPSGSNNSGPNGLGMRRVPSASNLTSGMSSFAGLMNNADKGKFGSMTSTPSLFDHQQQQQHSAAAQLSATALLQKAAQMGATASSTTLFRGFSPAAGDSSLSSHGKGPEGAAGTRQAPRQEPKRGGLDSIFAPSYTNTGRYGERSHLPGSSILGHGRTSLEVSDKNDSLSGQQLWGGGFGHASSFDTSSQSGYVHQQHADNFNMLEDSETSAHHGRSHFEAGTRGGTENHHEDRYGATTHDFLGVGAMSRIGRSTSMGQDFSQGSRTQYFNKFNK